ncbi:MAG: TdeIII family type II restriction endonuclease, partial [Ignavibacteria bacterium]|nr:TdeIII family type II restriction endonuclease [Ignavibacteria bacterium]
MNDKVKEKIACLIIEMIWNRFIDIPFFDSKDNPSVFQDSFIKNFNSSNKQSSSETPDKLNNVIQTFFLSKIADIVFFERTAQILCDGEKRKFKDLTINEAQQSIVSEVISSLKNNKSKPNLKEENNQLFSAKGKSSLNIPNFDADVYYEDENDIVVIEIKTVKSNSGIFKVEKEKILLAKAALKNLNPKKNIFYYLAFPFDPLNEEKCGYNKKRFFNYSVDFKKFFDGAEVL